MLLLWAGHYMKVSPGTGVTRDPAVLVSPTLKATGPSCHMTFAYYKEGSGSGKQLSFRLYELALSHPKVTAHGGLGLYKSPISVLTLVGPRLCLSWYKPHKS